MTLSRQVEEFRASEIVRMSRLCKEKNGINLAEGFPDFAAPNEVKKLPSRLLETTKTNTL